MSNLFRSIGRRAGDHIAFCPKTTLASSCCAGRALRRARLRDEQPPHRKDGDIIGNCVRGSSSSPYKADQAAELRDQMPNIDCGSRWDAVDSRPTRTPLPTPLPPRPSAAWRGHALQLRHDRRPKGVLPTVPETPLEESGTEVAGLLALLFKLTRNRGISRQRRSTCPLRLPATHVTGGTVVVMEQFDPVDYLRLVEEHRITISRSFPMFIRMLKLGKETRNTYDTSTTSARAAAPAGRGQAQDDRLVGAGHPQYWQPSNDVCNSERWLAASTVGSAVWCGPHRR